MNEFPVSKLLRELRDTLLEFTETARIKLDRAGLPQDEATQLALLREPLDGLRHRLTLLKTPEGQASAPAWGSVRRIGHGGRSILGTSTHYVT